jgi:hypothetical protein
MVLAVEERAGEAVTAALAAHCHIAQRGRRAEPGQRRRRHRHAQQPPERDAAGGFEIFDDARRSTHDGLPRRCDDW